MRAYSKQQVKRSGFPTGEYTFPQGSGSFVGELVLKMWNNNNALVCYFDTTEGEKYKLCVWFSYDANRSYRPQHSPLDLSYVDIGTSLYVEYDRFPNGYATRWLKAEIVESEPPLPCPSGDLGAMPPTFEA